MILEARKTRYIDFCDYYIEIAKERLYTIYTPYVTEYIYQDFYRDKEKEISLHETFWETKETDGIYIEFGEHLKNIIAEVRKNKTEHQMSMKDSIPELIISCPGKLKDLYKLTEKDIRSNEKLNSSSN